MMKSATVGLGPAGKSRKLKPLQIGCLAIAFQDGTRREGWMLFSEISPDKPK